MTLRPYRRIRDLENELAIRRTVDADRARDLADALAVIASLNRQLMEARAEMDGYDAALIRLAEGQRKLGVGG